MRRPKILAPLVAAAVLAGAGAASAAVVTMTYTGQISSGVDLDAAFGPAGANLAGQAFTAQFVVDDAQAGFDLFTWHNPPKQTGAFGLISGGPSGSVFTTGGQNVSFSSTTMATERYAPSGSTLVINQMTGSFFLGAAFLNYNFYAQIDAGPANIDYQSTLDATGPGFGWLIIGGGPHGVEDLELNYQSISVRSVGVPTPIPVPIPPAPEPATWAMLLLGFGMLGQALRRRRPVRSVAAG